MAAAAVAAPGPSAPTSGRAPPVACPQCGDFWRVGSLFVRDSCGHRKCRCCVIVEGNECGTCSLRAKAGDGSGGSPAAVPSPVASAQETAGGPAALATCSSEPSTAGANTGPSPVPETPASSTQPGDSTVKTSPSSVTASNNKKKDLPQQNSGKKVLDELNVTNANNVPELAWEDGVDAEAVDDPDPLPEGGRPAAKRPPPPTHGVIKLPGSSVMYCCTICGHKFKSRSTVRYHYYCGVENKPLTCELCKKGFVSKSHYEYHMRDHTGDLPYKCDVCGKGFKQKTKLTRHTIVHTDDRKFKCSTCGKHFAEASNLKVHSRLHTGERPYKCDQCGRSFNERANYNKHVRSIHTNERPYACEMCGKCFARSENLKVHLRRHKGIRPYECPVCSLTFSYKKDMTRHMPIHDPSVRPFECDKCSQTFKRKDNLLRHIKLSHSETEKDDESQTVVGERSTEAEKVLPRENPAAAHGEDEHPYACKVCGKCLDSSENLEVHLRLHKGSHPYECPVCSLTFSYKEDMMKHMPVHDPSTVEPGEEKTAEKAREEASKCVVSQSSTAAETVLTDSSIVPTPVNRAATANNSMCISTVTATHGNDRGTEYSQPTPACTDETKLPPDMSAACGSSSDANSSRPLRKRRVRVPPDPAACSSFPVFRRNVTPPPGALPEPPRVPRHCLPAPRERHVVLRPPVPVDFLETTGEKKLLRARGNGRKRLKREVEADTTDIEKVGFIQIPQYPLKAPPAPQPVPAHTRETTPSGANGSPKAAETCGAVPVIKRSQPSNCVPTITETPQRAVSTIVSPRNRELRPKPVHTAPPLPPLPACSPRPNQPMLRLLLHDTPCSDMPEPPPGPVRAETPPAPPAVAPHSADALGLCDVYECILKGNLGQLTSGRRVPERQLPAVGEAASVEKLRQLPSAQELTSPAREQVASLPQEQFRVTTVSTGNGKQKSTLDGKQPPAPNTTYFDTYCSYIKMHAKKQTVFCGKKSGKSTFIEEEQRHSVYAEVRRPGKRMSAISDRLSDDNEEDDDEALNYTLYGCSSGGKRIPDADGSYPRDSYRASHRGSHGDKTVDMFDVIAELRNYTADVAVPYRSVGTEVTGGVRNLSPHQDPTTPSGAHQPHVIVGTGKLSDAPYS
ncbi:zinc finger X-linked protein ZXDB-like isoform X2 [Schistocerca gregaria]|uniref:zinc finger X-linked protein ZXDB-like isoform X2 n=1 Tax=Schistocerca gregaria TaxID=7010 RepID=UPI00211DB605|nr:zinc finger X-linked protein ZXDB-like isoform X2 [Schistocerca gregaria]XP_049842758.1 zinc finger X-linked protein ZXDB-like isoform X2 [Schistocerca gregaria]